MVEAYPTAITYWVRHGPNGREEMLLNRPQYSIEEQKFTYKTEVTLTIDNFAKEDVGVYTCVSTNSLGLKESNVRVYGNSILEKIFVFLWFQWTVFADLPQALNSDHKVELYTKTNCIKIIKLIAFSVLHHYNSYIRFESYVKLKSETGFVKEAIKSSPVAKVTFMLRWFIVAIYCKKQDRNFSLKSRHYVRTNNITKKRFAPGEARTHGLQIMRLTRCLLRYRG